MSGGDDNLFDKYGLEVQSGQVEVGKTYPIYGMITKILDETFENFTIEINHNVTLHCTLNSLDSVEKLKERAFEPGIFVTEITESNPVKGHCTTIVFGKSNTQTN